MMAEITNSHLSSIISWHFLQLRTKGRLEINVVSLWVLRAIVPGLTTDVKTNVKILTQDDISSEISIQKTLILLNCLQNKGLEENLQESGRKGQEEKEKDLKIVLNMKTMENNTNVHY